MKYGNGWIAMIAFVLFLLFLWGGSYVWMRQFRQGLEPYIVFADGMSMSGYDRVVRYDRHRGWQKTLYYLHRPLFQMDKLLHPQNAPKPLLD